jgi:aspartyl-tRNA(Asn)/glutamyl-tRNA(Gln) amidotransferase subunit C
MTRTSHTGMIIWYAKIAPACRQVWPLKKNYKNMKIDKDSIKKIAHLARLEFDESSAEKMSKDMSQILDWVEQLNELDTSNVEPLTTMSTELNDMREDQAGQHLDHKAALKNAPKSDSDYFRVPKVLE